MRVRASLTSLRPVKRLRRSRNFALRFQDDLPQHDRIVVKFIPSRKYERDRTLARQSTQHCELIRMTVNLSRIPSTKLRPSSRIVSEPFPQLSAGSNVLHPLVYRGLRFLHSPRPEAIDQ